MIKTWWLNNSWRFWQIQWVLTDDPYRAVEIWQEYRYMLNPLDERGLTELIVFDYDADTSRAMQNPVVRVVFWVRHWLVRATK